MILPPETRINCMKSIQGSNRDYVPAIQWFLENVLEIKEYDIKVKFCYLIADAEGRMLDGEFAPPNEIFISQDLKHCEVISTLFRELRRFNPTAR